MARPSGRAIPVCREVEGPALAGAIGAEGRVRVSGAGLTMNLRLPPLAPAILRAVDGGRSLREIRAVVGADAAEFRRQFAALYRTLNGTNQMLLRYPAGSAG